MKLKKVLLTLGSISVTTIPIAAVISCGSPDSAAFSNDDMLRMSNLKSTEAKTKLENLWLVKVLMNEYKISGEALDNLKTIPSNVDFKNDFEETLKFLLRKKMFDDKSALSTIYETIRTFAPVEIAGDEKGEKALPSVDALKEFLLKRSKIDDKIDDIFATDSDWEKVFYDYSINKDKTTAYNPSVLGLKQLALQLMVTKKFMNITSDEYNKVLPDDYALLDSKFKNSTIIDSSANNFPLIMSALKSRLSYKWSIEMDTNKSSQFIHINSKNELDKADAIKTFDSANSKFIDGLNYSTKNKVVVDGLKIKDTKLSGDTLGYEGIAELPSGQDTLDTNTVNSLKLVTDVDARDGFIVDGKLINDKVRFTDKDQTKVELTYYTSLMPIYQKGDSSKDINSGLIFDPAIKDKQMDILMYTAAQQDSGLYKKAIEYFTKRENGIQLEITNDWARNYYIGEGLEFIKK